jgi:hypothetical protein
VLQFVANFFPLDGFFRNCLLNSFSQKKQKQKKQNKQQQQQQQQQPS